MRFQKRGENISETLNNPRNQIKKQGLTQEDLDDIECMELKELIHRGHRSEGQDPLIRPKPAVDAVQGIRKRPSSHDAGHHVPPLPADLAQYTSLKSMRSCVQKKARREALLAGHDVAAAVKLANAAVQAAAAVWLGNDRADIN